MQATRFRCLFVAAFLSVQPALPNRLLDAAKQRLVAADKISILKSLIRQFPTDPASAQARGELASILANANRYDEALQVYQASHPADGITIDFTLIDYLLKTGRYADV